MANKKKRWSEHWDCCQKCGTTKVPHRTLGLCDRCFNRLNNDYRRGKNKELLEWRKKYKRGRKIIERWAKDYDCCTKCGGMKFSHAGKGKCSKCYIKAYQKKYCRENPKKANNKPIGEATSVAGLKVRRQCSLCKRWVKMWSWEAFCKTCRESDMVRFDGWLPTMPQNIRRRTG